MGVLYGIRNVAVFVILSQIGWSLCVYSPEMETQIRSETVLHANYDYISRPNATTAIKIGVSLLAIDELNLKNQMFAAAGWITFEWEDYRLEWDAAARDDIDAIFSEPAKIWKPEIVIDNALDELGVISDSNLYLRVSSDGTIEWEPPLLFTTHCEADITFYPYDRQKCSINLISWGYTVSEVQLDFLNIAVNLEDFETHGEWEIYDSSYVRSNVSEIVNGITRVHPQLEFWVYIERRTMFYNLNVIMPIVLTSILVAVTFIVPVDSGEKLSYILTVFLALAVLLTIVSDSLPPTSITTSVLGLYLGIVTALSAVGIVLTVLLLLMYHKDGSPPRSSFYKALFRCTARFSCNKTPEMLKKKTSKVNPTSACDNDLKSVTSLHSEHADSDAIYDDMTWRELSVLLDRTCFIVFLVFTIVMNMVFLITLSAGGHAVELQ